MRAPVHDVFRADLETSRVLVVEHQGEKNIATLSDLSFHLCPMINQRQIGQILPSVCSQKQNWQRQQRELRGPVEQDGRRSSDGVLIFGAGTAV